MRRVAFLSLALAAACGTQVEGQPAPLDRFYKPTGLAFHDPWLLVGSSNFDLRYEGDMGGTVIPVDPSRDPALLAQGERVASFTGEIVLAEGCDSATYALVASRHSNILYQLTIDPSGTVFCDPATPCEIPLQGAGAVADPLAIEAVCTTSRKSAFVAYLRSSDGRGWVSEYELATTSGHALRTFAPVAGPVRSFAYDPVRDRLWMAVLATSVQSPLAWVDLGGGCPVDLAASEGGCSIGAVPVEQMPAGLEIRDIAFANPQDTDEETVRRVYLTGRLYDVAAAAVAGGRTVDLGGLIVVADLVENALGGVDMQVVRTIPIGRGAGEIRVLPKIDGRRDVVAALATDDGELWLYDDETLTVRTFGRNAATGAPVLGHVPFSMAVEPALSGAHGRTIEADVARLYVASFKEDFVTPVDVPLGDVDEACMVDRLDAAGVCVPDDYGETNPPIRIHGGTQ